MFMLSACGKTETTPTDVPSGTTTNTPAKPTDVPSDVTPSPTDIPATPTPVLPDVTPDDFDPKDFLSDVVYCGDSVLNFYQWQGPSRKPAVFGTYSAKSWLVLNSFAARIAVKDEITASDPTYNGEHVKLWDAIPQIGKKRVFLFFGLNDIGVTGVDKFLENYDTLINKIKATSPDVKFYILAVTPMNAKYEKADGSGLSNAKIMEADEKLEKYAKENGYGYIDVATPFRDENNALKAEFSDGTNVHVKLDKDTGPYSLWDQVIEQYAKEQLMEEYLDTFR